MSLQEEELVSSHAGHPGLMKLSNCSAQKR